MEAIRRADIVVLGSVLTHLIYEDALTVMGRFLPVWRRGGKAIMSVFLGDRYELQGDSRMYGCPNCYYKVVWTRDQLAVFDCEATGEFLAQQENLHRIFVIFVVTGLR